MLFDVIKPRPNRWFISSSLNVKPHGRQMPSLNILMTTPGGPQPSDFLTVLEPAVLIKLLTETLSLDT